jgi:inhibitor of cysteine peptidase
MNSKKNIMALGLIGALLLVVILVSVYFISQKQEIVPGGEIFQPGISGKIEQLEKNKIARFKSSEEFAKYLENSPERNNFLSAGSALSLDGGMEMSMPSVERSNSFSEKSQQSPDRFSETNIQVQGIDEPDFLKTDGKRAYYSPEEKYFYPLDGMVFSDEMEFSSRSISDRPFPIENKKRTLGLDVFPLENLKMNSEIDKKGQLLLSGEMLTIFSDDKKIYGYDVSEKSSFEEKWKIELGKNSRMISSRLHNGKIYLVTFSSIQNRKNPCPIQPMKVGEQEISFACDDIYYVSKPVEVNGTFQVMLIDPKSGEIEKKMAFAGSQNHSQNLYMSSEALYITFGENVNEFDLILGFIMENLDIFPVEIAEKMKKVAGYDISQEAKMIEFEKMMEETFNLEDGDESKRLENEFENRMENYFEKNKRNLKKTGIVKIGTKNLEVESTGTVFGTTLNQFSLDEYDGYLRVATTVGENFGSSAKNENDIYVLDSNLKIVGQIQGLGLDERIYSARFVGDKGYLVTFKQIDPFFVLNLSDPKNPQMKGELKIPGYSSYLHPIGQNLVLGIGMESGQVKISLFDVSDPNNPFEKDKYMLKEGWSEISETHHAFLIDQKHQIFFLPGGTGGYIFSYANEKLELKKAIDESDVNRAIYINDYLYIFSPEKVIVLDERNWERVKELEFEK